MANQSMASALDYAGYETKFVAGTGGHDPKHGGAIFPDALRWLWKDYPKPISKSKTHVGGSAHFITEILDPDSEWELVSEGHKFTEGPAVDRDGNFYFCDIPTNQVYKVGPDGKPVVFRSNSGGTNGLMFGPDGRLYAAQSAAKRVVAWAPDGAETVIADNLAPNDLAVTTNGAVYVTDPGAKKVWYIDPKGVKRAVFEGGIAFANGVRLSPDESLLYVADSFSRWVWSFQIQPDGSLAQAERFYHLELPDDVESGPLRAHGDGIAVDTEGYIYVATNLGVQICDQPGRVVGIINKPSMADPSNLVFGGPDLQTLYMTAGDKVWRRHLRRKGYFTWSPQKPPQPHL